MSINGADLLPHLIGVLLVAWAAVTDKLGRQAAAFLKSRCPVPRSGGRSAGKRAVQGAKENPFLKPLVRTERRGRL